MNKLFTKIASLTLGLAMAIGVGVALVGGKVNAKEVSASSYEIVFKSSSADGSTNISTSTQVSTVISSGTGYVSGFGNCTKAFYNSKSGLKLGGSSGGTFIMNIASSYQSNIKKIEVYTSVYGTDTGNMTLYSGNTSLETFASGDTGVHTFDSVQTVSSIKIVGSVKRTYISKIVLTTGENVVYPDTLTITSTESIQTSGSGYAITYDYSTSGAYSTKTMTASATKSGGGTVTDDSVAWTATNNSTAGISSNADKKEVTFYVNTSVPGTNTIRCTANGTASKGTLYKDVVITVTDPITEILADLKSGKSYEVGDQLFADDIELVSYKASGDDGGLTIADCTVSPGLPYTFTSTSKVTFTVSYPGVESSSFDVTASPVSQKFTITDSISHTTLNGGPTVSNITPGSTPNLVLAPDAMFLAPASITIKDSNNQDVEFMYDSDDGTIVLTVNDNLTITGTAQPATIVSIAKTAGKTEFKLGENFSTSDLEITATYNDTFGGRAASTQVVTSGCTIDSSRVDTTTLSTGSGYKVDVTHTTSEATCYYYVTVVAVETSETRYQKVTTTEGLTTGQYLLVYEGDLTHDAVAFDGSLDNSDNDHKIDKAFNGIAVEIDENDAITYTSSLANSEFTLDAENGTLRTKSGFYIGQDSYANGMKTDSSTPFEHYDFEIDETNDYFSAAAYFEGSDDADTYVELKYNYSTGDSGSRFRYYKSGQQYIQAYKYIEGVPQELVKVTATLVEKDRTAGQTLQKNDFVVKLYYNNDEYSAALAESEYTISNVTLVEGDNNQCTITHTASGKTVTVKNISAAAARVLQSISWTQAGYYEVVGNTLNVSNLQQTITTVYDTGSSSTTLAFAELGLYSDQTKDAKVKTIANGYTWTSSDNYYLGVSYTEDDVTCYAFSSSKMTMVDRLAAVYTQTPADVYEKVSDASELKVDDVVVIVSSSYDKAIGTTQNTNNRAATDVTKTSNYVEWTGTSVQLLTIKEGTVDDTFAFYTGSGYLYAASSSANQMKTQTTLNDNGSFTISIDEGIATITAQGTNSRNLMQYNKNDTLFSCYASAQSSGGLSIYKFKSTYIPGSTDLANTDAVQQKAVLDFIEDYTETVEAICLQTNGGTDTEALKAAWNGTGTAGLTGRFTTASSAGQNFKDLFKYGYSDSDSEDPLRKMLGSYNWIYAKYGQSLGLTDFLNTVAGRASAPSEYRVQPTIAIFGTDNANSVAIIVVISVASLTAIGGYFFLRKRREQN